MKKLLALGSALVLAVSAMPAVLAEDTDAFTSASVSSYYGDFALTGDELMNAINSFSGTYLVCTTNPDGTANAGVFIFACVKNEDKYYIQMGLAENQTKQNLLRTAKRWRSTPRTLHRGRRKALHHRRCAHGAPAGD